MINSKIQDTTRVWAEAKDETDKMSYAKAIHQVILNRFGESELMEISKEADKIQKEFINNLCKPQ